MRSGALIPLIAGVLIVLPACGKRSVTVRNATQRTVTVRLVHDAFLSGERTLDVAQMAPDERLSFGPYTRVPLLDPIDIEVSLGSVVGDVPLTHRIDKRNVSLVIENAGLESWSGLVIRRDDLRFK